MARKLLSTVLLLVIVAGSYALIETPTAQAAVNIREKCQENCLPYMSGPDVLCVFDSCSKTDCFYRCYYIG